MTTPSSSWATAAAMSWEACDEVADPPGLQEHTVIVAEGQRPEPSYFGSNDHPGPTGSWVTVLATHRLQ
jgi:hypothetical protein